MLSPLSKIWVYQASRIMTLNEYVIISNRLKIFVENWASHGSKLIVTFEIKHFCFVIIAVDESKTAASGCSIDKSVQLMKELEVELGLNLMDRNLAYIENGNVHTIEVKKIKSAVLEGKLKPDTLVFDNTIATYEEFETKWHTKASETWLKRYFDLKESF